MARLKLPGRDWLTRFQPNRFAVQNGLPEKSVSAAYVLLRTILKQAQALGKDTQQALEFVATLECKQVPPQEITDNFEAWIAMQGTSVLQYDRICDRSSARYCKKTKGRGSARGCPPSSDIEEHESTYFHIGGVAVSWLVVGLVSAISTIVIVVSVVLVGVIIFYRRKSAVTEEEISISYTALE